MKKQWKNRDKTATRTEQRKAVTKTKKHSVKKQKQ